MQLQVNVLMRALPGKGYRGQLVLNERNGKRVRILILPFQNKQCDTFDLHHKHNVILALLFRPNLSFFIQHNPHRNNENQHQYNYDISTQKIKLRIFQSLVLS